MFQIGEARSVCEVGGDLGASDLDVWLNTGSVLATQHTCAQGHVPARPRLARQAIQVARIFAQPQLALQQAKGALYRLLRKGEFPHPPGAGMHPVDHQMEVGVVSVLVRHRDCLVFRQVQVTNQPVRHLQHEGPVCMVRRVKADGKVVGRCRSRRRRGEQRHYGCRIAKRRRPDVEWLIPGDPMNLSAISAGFEVGDEVVKAGAERFMADHRSLIASKISRSPAVARSASRANPAFRARSIAA